MRTTLLLAGLLAMASATTVAAEPTVDRLYVQFTPKPVQPDKKEWTFTPVLRTRVSGPISSSSAITVEYTLPSGKAWLKVECENVTKTAEDEYLTINDCGHQLEDKGSNQTGAYGFTVKLTDALANTNKVLLKGKFTIGRQLYNPSKQADRNGQFRYYVDEDWRLPIAFAEAVPGDISENLHVETWIKGPIGNNNLRGYLFFNGKQVAEQSASSYLQATPLDVGAFEYRQLVFKLPALVSKPVAEGVSGWKLWENPGEYEVKVLRDNKVVRTFKFTIGANGRPKDNGARVAAGIARDGALVKATVDGGDGTIRKDAYKTEAFFHNPVSGL